ncbi:hypothetical protein AG0111_0g7593 [Alternaria gaisen]|uniref:Uncharacterized protein n=1 Tax=Alternaria gaisen TaxID=167740 RepID=A0ACB6FIB1_9PLEO|nr:hypothetical protein AG0111_0g7593 [Alternaria gaisen]
MPLFTSEAGASCMGRQSGPNCIIPRRLGSAHWQWTLLRVNKTSPLLDSSAKASQPPQPCDHRDADTTVIRLTANLLDPLFGHSDSITPPPTPRYCIQLRIFKLLHVNTTKLATLQVFEKERPDSGKLDFEARVPIPFSVFPSAYRNAEFKETTSVKVEEQEAQFEQQASHGREGHEETHESFSATVLPPPPAPQQQQQPQQHDTHVKEEVHIYEEERLRRPQPPQQQFQQAPQPRQFHAQQPPQHREELHIHEQTRYRQPQQQFQPPQQQSQPQFQQPQPHSQHVHRTDRVEFERSHDRYQPHPQPPTSTHSHVEVQDTTYDRHFNTVHGPATDYAPSQIDVTERQIRERTRPIVAGASYSKETYTTKHDTFPSSKHVESVASHQPSEVRVETSARSTAVPPKKFKRDMGYYDNEGQYHSLRQGISHAAHKVADRIQHPIHPHRHHHSHEHSFPGAKYDDEREEVIVKEKYTSATPSVAPSRPVQSGVPVERVVRVHSNPSPPRSTVSAAAPAPAPAPVSASIAPAPAPARPVRKMASSKTITIPCHHIRIGDLLILQGRPCQVIRITTSSQTGQHRYLGVDLFTKQLHEESSFISNPAPSVVVQNMLGPVFKQYRVLDIREDGRVVAMTESGDVKQGLPVLDQSGLISRLTESFDNGRGSVRILVIDDDETSSQWSHSNVL